MCSQECFSNLVANQVDPENLANFVKNNCQIVCYECNYPFTMREVGMYSSQEAFEKLIKAREDKIVSKLQLEHEQTINQLKQQLTIEKTSDIIQNHRKYICEQILTIKCPNCTRAFIDFNGCFALTCTCGSSFCGWCLQLGSSREIHTHVCVCQHRTQGTMPALSAFNLVHKNRRIKLLTNYLNTITNKDEQKQVIESIKKDLTDLQINIQFNTQHNQTLSKEEMELENDLIKYALEENFAYNDIEPMIVTQPLSTGFVGFGVSNQPSTAFTGFGSTTSNQPVTGGFSVSNRQSTGFSFGNNNTNHQPVAGFGVSNQPSTAFTGFGHYPVAGGFSVSNQPSIGFSFGAHTQQPSIGFGFGNTTNYQVSNRPSTRFSFGVPTQQPSIGFGFGNTTNYQVSNRPSSGFGFGAPTQQPSVGFGFGAHTQQPSSGFGFGAHTQQPSNSSNLGI
jgi:hypothetical protein